jgi:tRNA A-37 threonylcarbamoyl transferase component Bud32
MAITGACERFRARKFVWWVNREFLKPELRKRLAEPGPLMGPPGVPIPRRDGLARVTELVRTQFPELPENGLIIKRYRGASMWRTLKDVVRPSRARRAFERALILKQLGVATPTPIAVGERRCCRWLQEAFLISEEISDAKTVWEHRHASSESATKHVLARALGRTLARLHNAGFAHSDPNFSNFLVRGPVGLSRELVAIDLDGVSRRGFISARAAAKDLYRLVRYMERTERLWFVAQYCRGREPRLDAREFDRLCDKFIKPRPQTAVAAQPNQGKACQ